MLGISFLAAQIQAVPAETETVISQLVRTVFNGRGIIYLATILSTTVILVLAANTSFADFPRLSAIAAADGFLPRQLTFRGSRLVYSRGIMALAFFACILLVIFRASVTSLIPLYAIGVFLSFTMSQTGMARRWWKIGHLKPGIEVKERGSTLKYGSGWQLKMIVNGFGAALTALGGGDIRHIQIQGWRLGGVILIPCVGYYFCIHSPSLPGSGTVIIT